MIYTLRAEGPRLYKSRRHRTEVCNRLRATIATRLATNEIPSVSNAALDMLGNKTAYKRAYHGNSLHFHCSLGRLVMEDELD